MDVDGVNVIKGGIKTELTTEEVKRMYPLFDEFINKIINETAYGKFLKIYVDIEDTIMGMTMNCHFMLPICAHYLNGSIIYGSNYDYKIYYEIHFKEQMPLYVRNIDYMFTKSMAKMCKEFAGTSVTLNANTEEPTFEI